MRVFTFISKQGDGLPLAQRVVSEGHRVVFYINDEDCRSVGSGLVEKSNVHSVLINKNGEIDNDVLEEVLHPRPDCVVMDMVGKGYGKLADELRKKNIPVIGGCAFADQIELDRIYGNKLMKMHGINTPEVHKFNNFREAIKFVESKNAPFVYKPCGNQPTTTTYVAREASDLIGILEFYEGEHEEFELQEKVDGVEVSTELWFNGEEVINVNHTMEEKALMEGGVGPKAGCMGDVVWNGDTSNKLYKQGVGKLEASLRKIKYRGPLDLNTIVSKDKLYGLEFTSRFGYNAIFSLLELYKGRINDLLYGVATGVIKTMPMRDGWGCSITIALPPYPHDIEPDMSKNIPVLGVNKQNEKHIWFYDVYKNNGNLCASGNGGSIGAITSRGDTIREVRRRVYRTLDNLIIPDVMYRKDIGQRVPNDFALLKEWGWIK